MHAQVRQIRISGWKAGLVVLLVLILGALAAMAGVFLLMGGTVVALLAGLWFRMRLWLARRSSPGRDAHGMVRVETAETSLDQEATVREIQVDEVVVRNVSMREREDRPWERGL